MFVKIIGFVSAILTTTAFLPQAVKTWRTRSTEDLSPIMFILFFLGIIGWLLYGILKSDLPMILANSVTICLAGIIMFFILKKNSVQRIHHIAIYTENLEKMKDFYIENFRAKTGKLYVNPTTKFSSYFISLNSGCKLEIMHQPERASDTGYDHISISVGNNSEVDLITERLKNNGFEIKTEPRLTGDGYYESTIIDPDGNKIEITI